MTANPGITLKQDGEKLTGDYTSAQYGKFPINGTVKGNDVTFWFAMSVEGTALNVTYTGKIEADGSLKGSVNYGDMMSGTFSATKRSELTALSSELSAICNASSFCPPPLARICRSASTSSPAVPAPAGPSSVARGAGTRFLPSRRVPRLLPERVEVLDGVVQEIRVHVADVEIQLVPQLRPQRLPVCFDDVEQVVLLPLLRDGVIDDAGVLIPDADRVAVLAGRRDAASQMSHWPPERDLSPTTSSK